MARHHLPVQMILSIRNWLLMDNLLLVHLWWWHHDLRVIQVIIGIKRHLLYTVILVRRGHIILVLGIHRTVKEAIVSIWDKSSAAVLVDLRRGDNGGWDLVLDWLRQDEIVVIFLSGRGVVSWNRNLFNGLEALLYYHLLFRFIA